MPIAAPGSGGQPCRVGAAQATHHSGHAGDCLSEPHGKKYAVIVNELGEIGVDDELIVNADEEVFEMKMAAPAAPSGAT